MRALELFDSAAVFEHYFRQLVHGYAAEWLHVPPAHTSSNAARKFVRALQHVEARETPAVGLGTEISGSNQQVAVLGLRVEDRPTPVHIAAFAA